MIQVNPRTVEAYQLVHKGTLAFARAERQGFRIDVDYVQNQKRHITRRIERLESNFKSTKFYRHWEHTKGKPPNINSTTQLGYFLYSIKKIKPKKTTVTGQGSTDEEALKLLNIPELYNLLQVRKLKKIRDTYLDAFIREAVNRYIHPFFNLHLVRTHRSSSDSPNFQNIPHRDKEANNICRRAVYPRKGHQLLEVDYGGLEFRIIACHSNDSVMIDYINNPKSDIHGDTAIKLFKLSTFDKERDEDEVLRQTAKNGFVFPQLYGDYYGNCAHNITSKWINLPKGKWKQGQGLNNISNHLINIGIKSYDDFEKHIKSYENDFRSRFEQHWRWMDNYIKTYKKYGFIDLKTGFRCGDLMSKNQLINTPIQGAAFHCLLWSFIRMDKILTEKQLDTKLIGQIHDSMIFDVDPNELDFIVKTVKKVTTVDLPQAWKWINVPLEVDMELSPVDHSWADKQHYSA